MFSFQIRALLDVEEPLWALPWQQVMRTTLEDIANGVNRRFKFFLFLFS
jgi:hypothetical protein